MRFTLVFILLFLQEQKSFVRFWVVNLSGRPVRADVIIFKEGKQLYKFNSNAFELDLINGLYSIHTIKCDIIKHNIKVETEGERIILRASDDCPL